MSKAEEGSAASSPHVFGLISDAERYIGINPRLEKAFKFLSRDDLDRIACGRYDIDGENCWANVVECDLKMPPPTGELAYEVHRAYIDIQSPITGKETIGFTKPAPEVFAGFNVEKDYVLVFIDSPSNKGVLSKRAKKENPKLVKKYGINGFPTALILDGDGKKVGETGYRKGGPAKYAAHLMEFRTKRRAP